MAVTESSYNKWLFLSKKEILSKLDLQGLLQLSQMMGGIRNFSSHFGIKPKESDAIFPKVLRGKGKAHEVAEHLARLSRENSPEFIPPFPEVSLPQRHTRKPRIFSNSIEVYDPCSKLIFSPVRRVPDKDAEILLQQKN